MVRTVSFTEAKDHFGAVADSIKTGNCGVIVENRGEALFAMIPISRYEDLVRFNREQRRKSAVDQLRRLRVEIQARNPDLTEALADDLAERASADIVDAISRKLKTPGGV